MKPIRTCIVCREKNSKDNLLRIVSDYNGNAIYDKNQNINSRGIYICKCKKCIDKAFNLLDKKKFNAKISVNNSSLVNVLKYVESELGE